MRALTYALPAFVTGIALWQAIIWIFALPKFILPTPLETIEALWTYRELLWHNAIRTIQVVMIGLALGVILGAATALQLAASPLICLLGKSKAGPQGFPT